jgi:hypothetical protein
MTWDPIAAALIAAMILLRSRRLVGPAPVLAAQG